MRKHKKRKKVFFFFFFLFFIWLFFFLLMESLFLPALKEISHIRCKAAANEIIDTATMHQLDTLDTTELLTVQNGNYIANTALVNRFCSLLSQEITNALYRLPEEKILIPFGAAGQLSFFANIGPHIPFTLIPMGNAQVEYQTDFSSAGINQINYKIWIEIMLEIRIVNPLYQETVQMKRKFMLADLIYGGEVPEHYVRLSGINEYLLTE